MELISPDIKIDFIGKAKFAFVLSALLIAGSIAIWLQTGDEKFGIDYKGGHALVVKLDSSANSQGIRKSLKGAGFETAIVQSFEAEDHEYSIRLGGSQEEASKIRQSILDALKVTYSTAEIIQTDYVGPTIGAELRRKALIAVIVGLIGILAYISYRFDFAFALGGVAALFHDVIICMGVYLFFGHTINMATLAAALTVVGYSVNDTIIVFDRMREEIHKVKEFYLDEMMNRSICLTLSRTLITSLLTLFSAIALLLFGGGAIEDLALFLTTGIITGTYSTIFIASPVAKLWEDFRSPAPAKAAKA